MPIFHIRLKPVPARPARRATPCCRGGASSLLRLIPRPPLFGQPLSLRATPSWMGADDFAPSRWLIGR
jgi:hypothetical protein